jgi:trichothecene 3-O-acetyltransferase
METISVLLRPTPPLIPESVRLSPLDQAPIRRMIQMILCFKLEANASREVIATELQQGLINLLPEAPFLAGNLTVEDKERYTIQLEVPHDAGVEFRITDLTQLEGYATFDELEKAWIPPSSLNSAMLVPQLPNSHPRRCLLVQANFISGGLLLTTSAHHSVMDAGGVFSFLKHWSRHTAAVSEARILFADQVLPDVTLDRSLLSNGTQTCDVTDYNMLIKGPRIPKAFATSTFDIANEETMITSPPKSLRGQQAYWYISRDKLRDLQMMAKPTNQSDPELTENSTLSAFLWQEVSRARNLEQRGFQKTMLRSMCDIRGRLDPPLHPDYLGNAYIHFKTDTSTAELLSVRADALYQTALRISDSVKWWNSDRIWAFMGAVEAYPGLSGVRDPGAYAGPDLLISNMSQMPLHEFSWGRNLGTVHTLRSLDKVKVIGWVAICPRLPDGGLEILTCLEPDTLERLRHSAEFTRFIEWRCGGEKAFR